MRALIGHLRELGWDARQCFAVGETAYRAAGSRPARLLLRLRMYGLYPLQLAARLLSSRSPAVLVVTSNTFYAPFIACVLGSRRHRVVHLLYDLFPDALVQAGVLRPGSPVHRIMDRLAGAMLARADDNIFLGERLLAHASRRFGEVHAPGVIPVGADDASLPGEPSAAKAKPGEPPELLYCGNFGHLHDEGALAGALELLAREGALAPGRLRVRIHASGPRCAALRGRVEGLAGVAFGGFLAGEAWARAMRGADAGLVTMKPGAETVVMPSKAYSALLAGQAIIAVAPAVSDLASLVRRHECGWVIEPGNAPALAGLLRSLPERRDELRRCQENARDAAPGYSARSVSRRWDALLRGQGAGGAAGSPVA